MSPDSRRANVRVPEPAPRPPSSHADACRTGQGGLEKRRRLATTEACIMEEADDVSEM